MCYLRLLRIIAAAMTAAMMATAATATYMAVWSPPLGSGAAVVGAGVAVCAGVSVGATVGVAVG